MYPVVRRLLVVVSMLALIVVGGLASPASATQSHPVPNSMASMGDSITRAFNACGWYFDCTSRSFSTGSSSSVNSHYLRILDVNPAILGNNYNEARSGAKANEMASQASAVVNRDAEYVTILIGANDACTSSEDSMTPVDTFRAQIDDALDTLQAGLPDARVYVMTIPDIKRLWEVGHTSSSARFYWSAYNICQSMLANPTSFAEEDVQRRDRVQQRVIDYNTELADACAGYGANCTFDDNAVFGFPFELEHLSGWDYFHPNTEGQALLAQISYEAGFNW
jgi:lysophospholipase L1-like esterase